MRLKLNQPTKRLFEKAGWLADVTEHFNPYAGKTNDLFGFADLLATLPGERCTVALQVCTSAHKANRRSKILGLVEAYLWMLGGNEIWIVHWTKRQMPNPATGRMKLFLEPRVEVLKRDDFSPTIQETGLERYLRSVQTEQKNDDQIYTPEKIPCLTESKSRAETVDAEN